MAVTKSWCEISPSPSTSNPAKLARASSTSGGESAPWAQTKLPSSCIAPPAGPLCATPRGVFGAAARRGDERFARLSALIGLGALY
jgi:hypothetical protein